MNDIPADAARRLLLEAQGLLADPSRACTAASLRAEIRRIGFVQLDTISVVARAHEHIVFSRFDSFEPATLASLLERGHLFEHFTHDASLIPVEHWPHWRHRFARHDSPGSWIRKRLGGDTDSILAEILRRIESEGPLKARDFEDDRHTRGTWWDWKPAKAALEYLWHSGKLAVKKREGFQKVYDLTHRVVPKKVHETAMPDDAEHVDWACRTAMQRLHVATATEVAQFWRAIPIGKARAWCAAAVRRGEIEPVRVIGVGGEAVASYALPGVALHAAALPDAPDRARVLSPFDPVVRDRKRLLRLFGFDYRFEAFVPAPKRKFGYYVLPVLHGDRLIARIDAKADRAGGVLGVREIWWEPHTKPTPKLRRAIEDELRRYARLCQTPDVAPLPR